MSGETIDLENYKIQLRKGSLEFCILLIISKGESYASDILSELKQADLLVVEGTLYPLLSRMRTAGWLNYTWVESQSGPPRKYYSLTPAGKTTLKKFKENWEEFNQSINKLIKIHDKND